ncbi:hypothetical protein K3495_g5058 [Podosphaera aphanis]|nr:hypothetical protein K3495_g5058 [Podosphaera aphanis]
MPAQNQKKDSYLGRQNRKARSGSSCVNSILDESITVSVIYLIDSYYFFLAFKSPYQRRRVQGRAECQKKGDQFLFGYDPNNRFDSQDESPSRMPRLAWGDIRSKEATNKALDIANLMAKKDQMNAARRLMASASFASELGLEWVFWPETEPYKLSNTVDSCWKMVQNDTARTAVDTIPKIEELLARNVRDYPTEKRNQFRCFCSEKVQGLLPVARQIDSEDHFVFWKNLTDDFKILWIRSGHLSWSHVFNENEGDSKVADSLRTKVKRTTTWLDWCRALEGSPDGVYRWAPEKDWTFEPPAIEAANETEVQTIQRYADLRTMLKHVGNGSIIVYRTVNYELTD